ncbi:unnamed protein product [Clonostachys byssicola]|uniref:Uncharacterized protein n=1 Tax=Clonostachys byssicola TaxID=160290 RepID=A0A9N9Y6V2_9HYPO|nr:unnamed protein product [Clonostachys byssicola]
MSYSIKARVYQTNTNAYFNIVEKGVWQNGTWSDQDGVLTLAMGGSGTSGMLRFMTEQGKEIFFVTLGVHNWKPWVDITEAPWPNASCVKILPEYYDAKYPVRCAARDSQRASHSIHTAEHRTISAEYKVAEGHNLELNIVIG